jgi:hypothetical protein
MRSVTRVAVTAICEDTINLAGETAGQVMTRLQLEGPLIKTYIVLLPWWLLLLI